MESSSGMDAVAQGMNTPVRDLGTVPLLEVENLTKTYGKKEAVRDFSLTVQPGQCVGIVGTNGAGKTTLIRTICTLLHFRKGTIRVGGHDIKKEPVQAKMLFGYVAEMPNPYELLTVWEHVSFIARAYGMRDWEQEAEEMIREFDLGEKRNEFIKYLSKGQKQKVCIICAFIHRPRLLLLDEPIIGIDAGGVRALRERLKRFLADGGAVVISSHMLHFVETIADRILIMHDAEIIARGTLAGLRARYALEGDLEDLIIRITSGDGDGTMNVNGGEPAGGGDRSDTSDANTRVDHPRDIINKEVQETIEHKSG